MLCRDKTKEIYALMGWAIPWGGKLNFHKDKNKTFTVTIRNIISIQHVFPIGFSFMNIHNLQDRGRGRLSF